MQTFLLFLLVILALDVLRQEAGRDARATSSFLIATVAACFSADRRPWRESAIAHGCLFYCVEVLMHGAVSLIRIYGARANDERHSVIGYLPLCTLATV